MQMVVYSVSLSSLCLFTSVFTHFSLCFLLGIKVVFCGGTNASPVSYYHHALGRSTDRSRMKTVRVISQKTCRRHQGGGRRGGAERQEIGSGKCGGSNPPWPPRKWELMMSFVRMT